MAIYHCSTKPISRASGRSATASSAYRSGSKITDRQTGEIHDYTKKQGVIHAEIIAPKSIDSESITREGLWNLAEQAERRKDARVAREFVIALPHEINRDRQIEVAKEFSQYLSNRYNVVADLAIHEPSKKGNDKNVHAHIMITTREVAQDKKTGVISLTEKSTLELSNNKRKSLGLKVTQEDIKEIREKWADLANRSLKKEGLKDRIDHRSYADQKKDQIPTKHEGPAITEARRRGAVIGIAKLNEEIKEENKLIKSRKIEEQQNRKPSFFEKLGLKKVEKIEADLPPISEVIKGINEEIKEAKRIESQAIIERAEIRKQELSGNFIGKVKRSTNEPKKKESTDIWKALREKHGISKNKAEFELKQDRQESLEQKTNTRQNKAEFEPKQDRQESLEQKTNTGQNKAEFEPKQDRQSNKNREIDDYWDMDR